MVDRQGSRFNNGPAESWWTSCTLNSYTGVGGVRLGELQLLSGFFETLPTSFKVYWVFNFRTFMTSSSGTLMQGLLANFFRNGTFLAAFDREVRNRNWVFGVYGRFRVETILVFE